MSCWLITTVLIFVCVGVAIIVAWYPAYSRHPKDRCPACRSKVKSRRGYVYDALYDRLFECSNLWHESDKTAESENGI